MWKFWMPLFIIAIMIFTNTEAASKSKPNHKTSKRIQEIPLISQNDSSKSSENDNSDLAAHVEVIATPEQFLAGWTPNTEIEEVPEKTPIAPQRDPHTTGNYYKPIISKNFPKLKVIEENPNEFSNTSQRTTPTIGINKPIISSNYEKLLPVTQNFKSSSNPSKFSKHTPSSSSSSSTTKFTRPIKRVMSFIDKTCWTGQRGDDDFDDIDNIRENFRKYGISQFSRKCAKYAEQIQKFIDDNDTKDCIRRILRFYYKSTILIGYILFRLGKEEQSLMTAIITTSELRNVRIYVKKIAEKRGTKI